MVVALPPERTTGVVLVVPSPKSQRNSLMDPPMFGSVALAAKV